LPPGSGKSINFPSRGKNDQDHREKKAVSVKKTLSLRAATGGGKQEHLGKGGISEDF